MNISSEIIVDFRKYLHSYPELSGKEYKTIEAIISFISKYSNNIKNYVVYNKFGENSLSILFDSGNKGKNIIIRTDIDALPIDENIDVSYSSKNKDISHKCGHDGHTAILAGLAVEIIKNPINCGKVLLLFQSAEETGEGAKKVLSDIRFKEYKPDYIFGFHNLPLKPINKLYFKYNTFALASTGFIIKLNGKTSHAAEPEKGINPALAISEIIKTIDKLKRNENSDKCSLITFVHINMGEKSFGTSAGYGEIMLTIRSNTDKNLNSILNKIKLKTAEICKKKSLDFDFELTDTFPSTINHPKAVEKLIETANLSNQQYELLENPFRWSEDFGYYLQKYKGAYFGIGAGEDCQPLHSSNYDFPDIIIDNSIKFLKQLIEVFQK